MNKDIVKKILETNSASIEELNIFISEYVNLKLNRDVTLEELEKIKILINNGVFNLRFALLQAANYLDLNVMSVFDKSQNLLKTIVY